MELASPDGKGEPRLPLILSPEPSALPLPSKAAGFRWADLASPASTAGDATPLPESVGAGNAAASAAVGPMAFIAEEAPAAASDLEAPVEGLVEVTVAVPAAQAGSLPTPLVTLQVYTLNAHTYIHAAWCYLSPARSLLGGLPASPFASPPGF